MTVTVVQKVVPSTPPKLLHVSVISEQKRPPRLELHRCLCMLHLECRQRSIKTWGLAPAPRLLACL